MHWDDLRIFVAVAETGSLSAAARRLKLSQPTVGRRVEALETSLGTRLFDRLPRGYALTAPARRCCRWPATWRWRPMRSSGSARRLKAR